MAVDPALYTGDWTGKYADNKTFKISVSNVTGFRAKVQYQSGSTNKFAEVLIKDNAFRVGDTKFKLTKIGTAEIKNVITRSGKRQHDPRHRLRQENQLRPDLPVQALRSVASRRVGAPLLRSRAWK